MLNITAQSALLKTIVEILNIVVEEAQFTFEEERLVVKVVDPSHVAMVSLALDAAAFETWEVDPTAIGIELQKLRDMVGLASGSDLLEWHYDEAVGQLRLHMGKVDRTIRPLDPANMIEPRVPDLTFEARVVLDGSDLAQAVRAATQVGDLVTLAIEPQSFSIQAASGTDSVVVAYQEGELQDLSCTQPVKSQFSLQYLGSLARRMDNFDRVVVEFGENYPLRLSFTFADGAGSGIYFLAPRVEEHA